MFSVPKRKFPKAVDRNRIRRLMRENYRLLKPGLVEKISTDTAYHLAILYTGYEIPDYVAIQKGMSGALDRWLKKIAAETSRKET
jgi:ribonuclease P protein component